MVVARMGVTVVLLLVGAVVVSGFTQERPSSPQKVDPIVGAWDTGWGIVAVTGTGSSFTGRVTFLTTRQKSAPYLSQCPHPIGETIWTINRKNGNRYFGWVKWSRPPCRPGAPGGITSLADWTVVRPALGNGPGVRGLLRLCGDAIRIGLNHRGNCVDIRALHEG